MNNIQLKVKLVAVKAEYVGKDAKIVVSGVAKFQFDDQGKMKTRSIPYKANTARLREEGNLVRVLFARTTVNWVFAVLRTDQTNKR